MFPYEIKPLEENLNKELLEKFKGERSGWCQVGPEKWLLPLAYQKEAEAIYNLDLREDDVFIVTFPRTGTTLTQELIWMVNNNFDYETSAKIPLFTRFPFIDINFLLHDEYGKEMLAHNSNPEVIDVINFWKTPAAEISQKTPSPRHLKTHLPFSLLPQDILEKCKVIYLARNMQDVLLSYYHHNKLIKLHDYDGDFETYWKYFKNDLVVYAPYWKHMEQAWARQEHPNLLFLNYEEIVKDTGKVIRQMGKFLGKPVSDENVEKLCEHLKIANFSKNVPLFANGKINNWLNETGEGFIRKGDSRGKDVFTDELKAEAAEWTKRKNEEYIVHSMLDKLKDSK